MNFNTELYVCKHSISHLVHGTFKGLKKPHSFYESLHHIVNQLYSNSLMYHNVLIKETKYIRNRIDSGQ